MFVSETLLDAAFLSPSLLVSPPHYIPVRGNLTLYMYIYIHLLDITISGWWFNPSEKISKSVGMFIPNIWKNKIHVPNHQQYIYINTIDIYQIL